MFNLSHALSLAAFLALATACSKQDAPAPAVGARTLSANSAAPAPTDPNDPPGGGGDGSCTPGTPTDIVKSHIRKEARLICAGNGWEIVTTTTPPDGFTFGLGCVVQPYPFSVDIRIRQPDGSYLYTYASGTYDENANTTTLSR